MISNVLERRRAHLLGGSCAAGLSAATVARVWNRLPAAERANAVVYATSYGEAGAIARYGPAIGIPRAMSASAETWPCIALDIRVTQVFEQTPGPGTPVSLVGAVLLI